MKKNDLEKNRRAIRNSTVDFLIFTKVLVKTASKSEFRMARSGSLRMVSLQLFDVDRSVVTKHLKNIFQDGELTEEATRAKFAQVAG